MMVFACIPNPFYDTHGYNNVWLHWFNFCFNVYTIHKNRGPILHLNTITYSRDHVFLHTILLSYLYQATPTTFRDPYSVQSAVWIPLIMHFMYSNWAEARSASLLIHFLI